MRRSNAAWITFCKHSWRQSVSAERLWPAIRPRHPRLWPRPDLRSSRPGQVGSVQRRGQGEGRGAASSTVWCIGLTVGGLLSQAATRDGANDRKLALGVIRVWMSASGPNRQFVAAQRCVCCQRTLTLDGLTGSATPAPASRPPVSFESEDYAHTVKQETDSSDLRMPCQSHHLRRPGRTCGFSSAPWPNGGQLASRGVRDPAGAIAGSMRGF
jgi:hypothetical protein